MKNLILGFINLVLYSYVLACRCPRNKPTNPTVPKDSSFTPTEITIGTTNYGIPFGAHKTIFLSYEKLYAGNLNQMNCPAGYHAPVIDEYRTIINGLGPVAALAAFKDPNKFGLTDTKHLFTKTKSFPDATTTPDNQMYEVVSIVNNVVVIQSVKLVNQQATIQFALKCIENSEKVITLNYSKYIFENKPFTLEINEPNYQGVLYKLEGETSLVGSGISKTFTFTKTGCYYIQAWALSVAETIEYTCKVVYASPVMGNNNDYTFSVNKIKSIDTGIKINVFNSIFFSASSYPIGPKEDGGFYLLYSQQTTKGLYMLEYSSTYQQIAHVNLGLYGDIFDITATSWGFVVYYRIGLHDCYLVGFYFNYQMKFRITVMNGLPLNKVRRDQLTLFSSGGGPQFGLEATFFPDNGKLAYGKGRIVLIYTHFNNFKALSNEYEEHTGDSVISVNDNGEDIKWAWAWGASHSNIQCLSFDGGFFHSSVLGDAFPENIVASVFHPEEIGTHFDGVNLFKNTFKFHSLNPLVSEIIPGNHAGKSCGRLAGSVADGTKVAVVYSVKPCFCMNTTYHTNKIGFVSYEADEKGIRNKVEKELVTDSSAGRDIVQLRMGKWGKNILVFLLKTSTPQNLVNLNIEKYTEDMLPYYMVIDFNGNIKTPFTSIPTTDRLMPINEDPRFLKNGDLVWGVAKGNNLVIGYLEAK